MASIERRSVFISWLRFSHGLVESEGDGRFLFLSNGAGEFVRHLSIASFLRTLVLMLHMKSDEFLRMYTRTWRWLLEWTRLIKNRRAAATAGDRCSSFFKFMLFRFLLFPQKEFNSHRFLCYFFSKRSRDQSALYGSEGTKRFMPRISKVIFYR